jgi:hypothetical protein
MGRLLRVADLGQPSVEGGNGKAQGLAGFSFVAIELFQHVKNMGVFRIIEI